MRFVMSSGRERSVTAFVIGLRRIDQLVFGGTLVPSLDVVLTLPTDGIGRSSFAVSLPTSVPPGLTMYLQAWIADNRGRAGFSASHTLALRTH
jgi:hypothetical protein